MPICSFFDDTQKNALGLRDTRGYWMVVGPHEVAHQWWGHTVGFQSYRDQWMSEGFAELSASIFVQLVYGKDPQKYQKFWADERELLTEKNKEGKRAIDVGPLTQGYRLATERSGFDIPRRLIYPKGAYVLHMVRMMLWSPFTGDKLFKETMHDFVQTYANRPASTEDFNAVLEKHWPKEMDFTRNGKLDWFFDEYVYGTALPSYTLDYTFETNAAGDQVANVSVTQANVDKNFLMPVPIYAELDNGKIVRLASAPMLGNITRQFKIPLNGLKQRPKRAMLNYYYDVLAAAN
jgi:aminopeptidase N